MIRQLDISELPCVFNFYAEVLGDAYQRSLVERWNWQFVDNPFKTGELPPIYVLIKDGRIGGLLASFSLPVQFQGTRYVTQCLTDFVTHPKYRIAGIALAKSMTDQPILCMGIPNKPSLPLWLEMGCKKLCRVRYQTVFLDLHELLHAKSVPAVISRPLHRLWKTHLHLRWSSISLNVNAHVETIDQFDAPDFDAFWQRCELNLPISIIKNAAYLTWRYRQGPEQGYQIKILKKQEQIQALVIYKWKTDSSKAVILEAMAPAECEQELRELTAHCLKEILKTGTKKIICLINADLKPQRKFWHSLGFYFHGNQKQVVGYSRLPGFDATTLTANHLWHLSFGDGEQEMVNQS